nr:GNAT family N-acetyltransferase [Thiocystis violacea]
MDPRTSEDVGRRYDRSGRAGGGLDAQQPAALISFETDRLYLRQWLPGDRAPFARLNSDPSVMEFFPRYLDRATSDAMADRCEALIACRGWGFWAAELKETRDFIGFVGLHQPRAGLPFVPCVEIGWRLARPYWGRGLATEAARGALRVGFEDLGLEEILAFTAVRNLRSRAVMKRLGMREDDRTFQHPELSLESPLREHCLFRLSRRRWAAVLRD